MQGEGHGEYLSRELSRERDKEMEGEGHGEYLPHERDREMQGQYPTKEVSLARKRRGDGGEGHGEYFTREGDKATKELALARERHQGGPHQGSTSRRERQGDGGRMTRRVSLARALARERPGDGGRGTKE